MTYIFAWTDQRSSFVIADSALTSTSPLKSSFSTFGERQWEDSGEYVEERALKIFRFRDCVLSGAGCYAGILNFVSVFARHRKGKELQPLDAFKAAVDNVYDPGHPSEYEMVLIYTKKRRGCLVIFNLNGNGQIQHNLNMVELGSVGGVFTDLCTHFIPTFKQRRHTPNQQLCIMLSVLQASAIRYNFFEHGVGGHFIGARVTSGFSHWQPDILYTPIIPDYIKKENSHTDTEAGTGIAVGVREDVVFVASGYKLGISAFANWSDKWRPDDLRERGQILAQSFLMDIKQRRFFAVTLISITCPNIVIQQMDGFSETTNLALHNAGSDRFGITFQMSDLFASRLSPEKDLLGPVNLYFQPPDIRNN